MPDRLAFSLGLAFSLSLAFSWSGILCGILGAVSLDPEPCTMRRLSFGWKVQGFEVWRWGGGLGLHRVAGFMGFEPSVNPWVQAQAREAATNSERREMKLT